MAATCRRAGRFRRDAASQRFTVAVRPAWRRVPSRIFAEHCRDSGLEKCRTCRLDRLARRFLPPVGTLIPSADDCRSLLAATWTCRHSEHRDTNRRGHRPFEVDARPFAFKLQGYPPLKPSQAARQCRDATAPDPVAQRIEVSAT